MRLWNHAKTTMLLGALMGLCMGAGYLIGGYGGLLIGLLFGGFGNVLAYFYSDKMAMAAMGGRELQPQELPRLHEMVGRLAERAGLPKPRVFVCPQAAPNAFATGRNPDNAAVAITEGMLRDFPEDEIEGVLAHELAHIRNRDMLISTVAAVMGGAISFLAYMALFFGGGDRNPLAGLLMFLLAPIAAAIIQMAISRQREYAADNYGGELCGDPLKLARALQRLESGNRRIPTETNPAFHGLYIMEPLKGNDIGRLFSTHPPVRERVELLQRQAREMRAG